MEEEVSKLLEEKASQLTAQQKRKAASGCALGVAGIAISLGMYFLLGAAAGWFTLAFISIVFSYAMYSLSKEKLLVLLVTLALSGSLPANAQMPILGQETYLPLVRNPAPEFPPCVVGERVC